jgi:hypothetical protein
MPHKLRNKRKSGRRGRRVGRSGSGSSAGSTGSSSVSLKNELQAVKNHPMGSQRFTNYVVAAPSSLTLGVAYPQASFGLQTLPPTNLVAVFTKYIVNSYTIRFYSSQAGTAYASPFWVCWDATNDAAPSGGGVSIAKFRNSKMFCLTPEHPVAEYIIRRPTNLVQSKDVSLYTKILNRDSIPTDQGWIAGGIYIGPIIAPASTYYVGYSVEATITYTDPRN